MTRWARPGLPGAERAGPRPAFDWPLTISESERADRLHRESVVIDLAFAGPCGPGAFTSEMEATIEAATAGLPPGTVLLEAMELPGRLAMAGRFPAYHAAYQASGVTAGALWVELPTLEEAARRFGFATAQCDRLPWLLKARTAADIRRAKAEGKHARFLYTESVRPIRRDLGLLDALHDLGLRMCQLTYNASDEVGTGWTDPVDRGLSAFGEDVVARLNELGIVVCVSHCSHRTTLAACRRSTAPVVASHSFARGRHAHARGRSDDAIRAIADTGGLIGVCAIPHFLAPGPRATVAAMLDHVDYIARLVGWQHVAIGTDWPLQAPRRIIRRVFEAWFPGEAETTDFTATLVGFEDYQDLPNVTRGLVARGYDDEMIRGILGENALRVLGAVWG